MYSPPTVTPSTIVVAVPIKTPPAEYLDPRLHQESVAGTEFPAPGSDLNIYQASYAVVNMLEP
jgi:hypothetical protein